LGATFDPERYRERIARSEQRLAAARRFEEPDQVPVQISVGGSFYCRLFGHNIAEYFQDRELSIEVQLKGLRWAYDELGDDRTGFGIGLDVGPIQEALAFGAEIVRPDDTSPWGRHIIQTPADAEALRVPDPAQTPGVQWYYGELQRLREAVQRLDIRLPVWGGLTIHPPLSAACALAGPSLIYEWMCEEPGLVKRLFGKLFEAFCRLVDYRDSVTGATTTSIGLADDNSAFVSEAMYREFVLPYNSAIYERYGRDGRYLHADGPNDHLFALYANVLRLTEMDIGGFSDLAAAKREMHGKTVIIGGLNCKDLYGDFEAARPAVERAVAIGAPGGGYIFGVGGETYAGVNPDTLIRSVRHAQQISRRRPA
jgi:uroporphyrinogen-III decarboxylase